MTDFNADRETLRALADDGNEEALDRLAELLDEACLRTVPHGGVDCAQEVHDERDGAVPARSGDRTH